MRGDARPAGQQLEQDGAARAGDAGDIERPVDPDRVELLAVRAALEIADFLPEPGRPVDEAAQRIEPAGHLERCVGSAGFGHDREITGLGMPSVDERAATPVDAGASVQIERGKGTTVVAQDALSLATPVAGGAAGLRNLRISRRIGQNSTAPIASATATTTPHSAPSMVIPAPGPM